MTQIPDIKFSIVADPKPAINSITSVQKAQNLMIEKGLKAQKDAAYKKLNIEKDLQVKIKRIWEASGNDWGKALAKSIRAKEDADRKILRSAEETQRKLSNIQSQGLEHAANVAARAAAGAARSEARAAAVAARANQRGRSGGSYMTLRGASMLMGANMLPGGSIARAGLGAGEMAFGGGASMGAAVAIGAAAAGIAVAIEGVKLSLEVGSEVLKTTFGTIANSLVSAITTIGGFQGIAGSLVAGVQGQRQSVTNFNAMPQSARGAWGSKLEYATAEAESKGTENSVEKVLKARKAWIDATGEIDTLNSKFQLMSEIASVMDKPLDEVIGQFATLRKEFEGLSDSDFQDAMLAIYGASKVGSVPMDHMVSMSKAFGKTGQVGNDVESIKLLSAVVQGVAPSMQRGSGSKSGLMGGMAATGEEDLINDMLKNRSFGANVQGGKILNYREALLNGVMQYKNNPGSVKSKPEAEVLGALSTHGNSRKEVDDYLQKLEDQAETVNSVNKSFEELKEKADHQLKVAFVELSKDIKDTLLPVLNDMAKKLGAFIAGLDPESLKKASKSLGDMFDAIVDMLPNIIKALHGFGVATLYALEGLLYFGKYILHDMFGVVMPGFTTNEDWDKALNAVDASVKSLDKLEEAALSGADAIKRMNTSATTWMDDMLGIKPVEQKPMDQPDFLNQTPNKMTRTPPTTHVMHDKGDNNKELIRTLIVHFDKNNRLLQGIDNSIKGDPNRSGKPNGHN